MRALISLVLVLGVLGFCGCDNLPEWLQFGRSKQTYVPPVTEERVEGTILATVNGRIITLEEFNEYINAYNQQIQASRDIPADVKQEYMLTAYEQKKPILDSMVERELMIAEALDRGYDKNKEILNAVKALKEQLLYAKMIAASQENLSASAQEVEAYYNIYRDYFVIPEERRVSMISVASEDKANEILIQLLQGANFAALARQNSTDKSASKGGDIDFIVRKTVLTPPDKQTMFEKFEEVAFSLELNKPSTVFKGPSGYYIIKVTEIKEASQRPLSEVYAAIEQDILLKKQEEILVNLIGNLRKAGNITVYDNLLRNQ
ncbi:MAG: peptidylprolyl isomerase [Candidatus Omnitrophica bacterium]|nr:peptidylprolyl isomerase [Candidatus Omnitrophota bacterium]